MGTPALGSADAGASLHPRLLLCHTKSPAQPPAALHARHTFMGCHHGCTSSVLTHLAGMTCTPGWVQRREELRQRLQLDKVLAPEAEAQASERDALAARQQVESHTRLHCVLSQGLLCCQACDRSPPEQRCRRQRQAGWRHSSIRDRYGGTIPGVMVHCEHSQAVGFRLCWNYDESSQTMAV